MQTRSDRVEALVAEMTLEEKCTMLAGGGAFDAPGCPRLGVPGWNLFDGPAGVRSMAMDPALAIPCGTALGATWDAELLRHLGEALGDECNDRDATMLLAPAVNLHRSPRGGRHFEYMSEDPELSAVLGAAFIEGLQSRRVACCVKHYVANEQETDRKEVDTIVDERTLREVYLRPFEAAVAAGARGVMSAYNYLNGTHTGAHSMLLQQVLRDEWGFDGVVVSDWDSIKNTVEPALHGLDLEMPGPGIHWGAGKLQAAVEHGDVPVALIDDKVRAVLSLLEWRGLLDGTAPGIGDGPHERAEHRALVRRAGAASIVLVKNERSLLPLRPGESVAVIGPNAARTAQMGGGSSSLTPYRREDFLPGFLERWDGTVVHAAGAAARTRPDTLPVSVMGSPMHVEFFTDEDFAAAPVATEERLAVYNVWHSTDFGLPDMCLRASFTLVAPFTGPADVLCAALGSVVMHVDGVRVADNIADPVGAGFGLFGGYGSLHLEQGREYSVVLESTPHGKGVPYMLLDVGIAPAPPEPERLVAEAVSAAAAADLAVVFVGVGEGQEAEGFDKGTLSLAPGHDDLVRAVLAANPDTVVVVNASSPVELPWLDDAPAVVLAWAAGQESGLAIVDVLTGDAEPAGRMPTTWARREEDTPSYGNFPGVDRVVRYEEGLLVGHRWFEAKGIEPLIPFGHGGSYTTFEWGAPVAQGSGTDLSVAVAVTNHGARAGSDVVQVYVAPASGQDHAPVRLVGFARVDVAAGDTVTARIELGPRSFARWDTASSSWAVDPGNYELRIAASATDVRSRIIHTL